MDHISETPLKIAVISDSQAYPSLHDWGMSNLEKSFKILAPMKPDVLVMAGDLADGTDYDTFRMYRSLIDQYFDPVPVHIGCAGNHDYWTPPGMERDPEYIYNEFCRIVGQDSATPLHQVVKGYDFIALSADINNKDGYSAATMAALEATIQKAVARDSEKPVFVVTHYNPYDTIQGSHAVSGRPELTALFNKYPQVISLSGHSHVPLMDERTIWQGGFTAINTSTLAYGSIEKPCYNTCSIIVPSAREAIGCMFMNVYPDHCEIHRYNAEDGQEIKPDRCWNFALPYQPENAKYGLENRAAMRKAPQFCKDTYAVIRYDYGFLHLIFDHAQHEDFTHFYDVKIYEKTKDSFTLIAEERYINDFYRPQSSRSRRFCCKLPGEVIKPDTLYRFEIYPVESFGKTGEPLSFERLTPHATAFKNSQCTEPL